MRKPYYSLIQVEDWNQAKDTFRDLGDGWVYRGQSDSRWELTTSLERITDQNNREECESYIRRELNRRVPHYVRSALVPQCELERLALLQHHGAPTRLLDFTRSPYIAAFFAFIDTSDECAVWAVESSWFEKRAIGLIREASSDLDDLCDLDESTMWITRPELFVRFFEYIFFECEIDMVFPTTPFLINERVSVQQGLFLCPGNIRSTFAGNLVPPDLRRDRVRKHVKKIVMSASVGDTALRDLDRMNINLETLFPGLDGFCRDLKRRALLEYPCTNEKLLK